MTLQRRTKHYFRAIVAISATAAWMAPEVGSRPAQAARWQSEDLYAPDMLDPGFEISQMGPVIRLPSHSRPSATPDWVQFDLDSCGVLQGIEDGRSFLYQGAFDDDDVADEDDPYADAQELISAWLSAHPEIAVYGVAVDKWCDAGDYWEDTEDTFEIA